MKKNVKINGCLYYRNFGEHPPILELKLGESLLPLIQKEERGAHLLIELQNCRKYFDDEYGLIIPKIEVSFNENLQATEYSFFLNAVELERAQVNPEGMDGRAPEVIIKEHIQRLLRKNITRILNQSLVIENINRARNVNPDIIDNLLFTNNYPVENLRKIFNTLLEENVSIIDMSSILETIDDWKQVIRGEPRPSVLVEKIREKLSLGILFKCADKEKVVHGILLNEDVTQLLQKKISCLAFGDKPYFELDSAERKRVLDKVIKAAEDFIKKGFYPLVFLCPQTIRYEFSCFLQNYFEDFFCISEMELGAAKNQYTFQKEGEITFEEK